MKISIIIPVYNVENYIEKCINSLINQTLVDVEFIFVNDGSPDGSANIIKKYQKKDKRIKLIEKENGGQASARNLGLKHATGEYVAFVDSDDYVDINMYKILYECAKKDDLDIVICDYYLVYNDKIVKNKSKLTDEYQRIIKNEEYVILSPCPWNKIIKRKYIEDVGFKFPEGIIYEDFAAIPLLGLNEPKVLYVKECLYYYVQSETSTMRNMEYKEKYENIFVATKYLYDNMIGRGFDKELEYMLVYHFLYLGSLNFYKYKKYKLIDRIANDMKKYFPRWYKNKLVLSRFVKKEIIYMKLFYSKLYFMICIYQKLFNRDK